MVAFTSGSALIDRGVSAVGAAAIGAAALTANTGHSVLHNFLKRLAGHNPQDPQKPPALEPKKSAEFHKKPIETFYDKTGGKLKAPYKLGGPGAAQHLNDYMALSLIVEGAKELLKQYGGKVPEDKRMQLFITRLDGKDIGVNLADVPSKITPVELANFMKKPHGTAAIGAITSQSAQIDVSKNGKSGVLSFPDCVSVKVALREL